MAAPERPQHRLPPTFRSDADVLAQHHRFIRTVEDDASVTNPSELRLARRYYDRLFKEYAIADLSLAQKRRDEERQLARELAAVAADGGADDESARRRRLLADLKAQPPPQIGLRWRTRAEVVSGRGHLSCGNRSCSERAALSTFELPFRWREIGEQRQRAALVKVRLCPRCAALLPRGGDSGSGGGGGGGGGRGRRRDEEEEQQKRENERAEPTARRRAQATTARSRSRSPPPQAAAAAPLRPPPPPQQPVEHPEAQDNDGDEDARMDRLVQDMIDAFEAGAG